MIHFILNDKEVSTSMNKGTPLLDFIRYQQRLTGTKVGCREGDCGACTVLVGEIKNGCLDYRSATSCLMAIGNAGGKHIVTVEGTNLEGLNFIQQCFAEEGATQCGFCTPGFMVSMAGFAVSGKEATAQAAVDAVNGNICRCTGYKSIERAAAKIAGKLAERTQEDAIDFAVDNHFLPAYFKGIKERLLALAPPAAALPAENGSLTRFLGGGTDLYVQQHDTMHEADIDFLVHKPDLGGITVTGKRCYLGATTTVTDIAESPVFREYFPELSKYIGLVSSTPIRNMATIAGNLVNASPIGDFTIFFLALDAQLVLSDGTAKREVPLQRFYKGYKKIDKKHDEFIEQLFFELPAAPAKFNFEKVSKRTHLDIASVNSALSISVEGGVVKSAHLSAGGVGPVPAYLPKASAAIIGKPLEATTVDAMIEAALAEIVPISDARGSAAYKRFLLGQLIKAHFITLYPSLKIELVGRVNHSGQ